MPSPLTYSPRYLTLLALTGALACAAPSTSPTPGEEPTPSTSTSPTATASPSPSTAPTQSPTPSTHPPGTATPSLTQAPTQPATPSPTLSDEARLCSDAPLVTYDNFGAGFMLENCQQCHASTAPNRYGAPEGVHFDTLEDVRAQEADILRRATGDTADMPPGGGVSEDDRYLLEVWLRCYEG